jgi:colanic acid/amylovoran biosynthesis protein
VAERYVEFMVRSIAAVRAHELEPVIVIHEANDRAVAEDLAERAGGQVPVSYEDALTSKGKLGACHAVIGSRYHAIVSALAQGVPVLGTSWSHKYEELFAAYDCSEQLISLDHELDVETHVDRLIETNARQALAQRIAARAEHHKAEVEQMWQSVESLLWSKLQSPVASGSPGNRDE